MNYTISFKDSKSQKEVTPIQKQTIINSEVSSEEFTNVVVDFGYVPDTIIIQSKFDVNQLSASEELMSKEYKYCIKRDYSGNEKMYLLQ